MSLRALITANMPGYIQGTTTAAEVLAWSDGTVTKKNPITGQDLLTWSATEVIANKLDNIIRDQENAKDAATALPHTNGVYNDAKTLWTAITSGGDLALDRDDLRTMVSGLVGNGLSAANKNALFAMSDQSSTEWESTLLMPEMADFSKLAHISEAIA